MIGPISSSMDLYGNEPAETTGPVGPFGTAEHPGVPEGAELPPLEGLAVPPRACAPPTSSTRCSPS
jgi:hypothetical protein